MGLRDRIFEALGQGTDAETVTRNSRIDIVGGGIDEIDPPEELDEFAEQAHTTGPVRKNLRQFVNDVWEPGYRVEAESEATEAFFMGGDAAPEGTPEGGFLENAAIYAGETHSDFYDFGQETTWQRWVRGTVLIERLKAESEDPESPITGYHFIRPETVYPRVLNNTNILLPPERDELPPDVEVSDIETTPRGEVAAYVQFDDESIIGIRRGGFNDRSEVPLSQNDVQKQVLDPDIGADFGEGGTQGVFGTSIIEGISDDIAEYKRIRRNRAKAIETKAYGIWKASFGRDVLDLGNNQKELIEWDNNDQDDFTREVEGLEPGEIVTHDGTIDFERFDSDVPDLVETINQYINVMLAPLPAPKYMIGFAEGINRDVTEEQKEAYHDLVSQERRYQEKKWTADFRDVAQRQGLDTTGLQLKLQPEESENPIMSLGADEIERMNTYVQALSAAAGPAAGPMALVDREELLDVLEFPVDDDEAMRDLAEYVSDAEDLDAMNDVLDVEALQEWSEGDTVDTPEGFGVVSEIRSEAFEGPDGSEYEPTEDSPVYVVATEDGASVLTADELSSGELPETDVEDPAGELEAMANVADAVDTEALQDDGRTFDVPQSWRESNQPARVIGLKAWAGMGGSFTGCTREMRGSLTGSPDRFCASFKDWILNWEGWRQ